jgi:hypothetical protein
MNKKTRNGRERERKKEHKQEILIHGT